MLEEDDIGSYNDTSRTNYDILGSSSFDLDKMIKDDFVFAKSTRKEFRIALNIQLKIFNTVCDI